METLYHCQYEIETPEAISKRLSSGLKEKGRKNLDRLLSEAEEKNCNKIIMVRGDTLIAGYLLVIQALTKQFNNIEVLMIGRNLSFYGIK